MRSFAEAAVEPLHTGRDENVMDQNAFEAFYLLTARPLRAYITGVCRDGSLADDILQKAYIRFLHSGTTVRSDDHQRAYLFRIAANLMNDHWRDAARETRLMNRLPPETAPTPGNAVVGHDMARVFDLLEPRERSLLWLAHVEEHDHREIAGELGVSRGSVKVLLFRARKKLATLLREHGLAPEKTI